MNIEDDIFKLLMIVLLLANDREGDQNSVFTDINQIIILGLIMGSNRTNNRANNRTNNRENNRSNLNTSNLDCNQIAQSNNSRRNRRIDDVID
ncbi:MAG: hypothetical protein LBU60_05625 [Clostridiales bacterium]|jgi:hypothetical protein|nr:hypothetical protein [Clostridiales bacterium]